jgi:hypothetical protein
MDIACNNINNGDKFVNMYFTIDGNLVSARALNKQGQTELSLPRRPPTPYFDVAVLHAIKNPADMRLFHQQSIQILRPLLPRLSDSTSAANKGLVSSALRLYENSCVHNPVLQRQRTGMSIHECPTSLDFQYAGDAQISFHVMHISNTTLNGKFASSFFSPNFKLVDVPIHASELAINPRSHVFHVIATLFHEALEKGTKLLGLMSDGVQIHCDFEKRFQSVLWNSRCSGHLHSTAAGGVLALGARERSSTWKYVNLRHVIQSGSLCYNIGDASEGVFAAVFHRGTFRNVIEWTQSNHVSTTPFSKLLPHLSDEGFIVRVVYPYLALKNRSVISDILSGVPSAKQLTDAEDNKWNPADYCDSVTEPRASQPKVLRF